MTDRFAAFFLAMLMVTLSVPAAGRGGSDLSPEAQRRWRDYILPDAEDLRWQAIPWRTSLTEALREATERRLPILLWAMDGHPFGHT